MRGGIKAIKNLVVFLHLAVLLGCQQAPTTALTEVADPFVTDSVLVDTRDSFLYVSSHIQGSVNLVTGDYLILKNPKIKKRIMDPDLEQTIERLSKKGISPNKRIVLLSEKKESTENKKWAWLLKQLGVDHIEMMSMAEFKRNHPNKRYAEPRRTDIWKLQQSADIQQEFILNKGDDCFVSWSDKRCSN